MPKKAALLNQYIQAHIFDQFTVYLNSEHIYESKYLMFSNCSSILRNSLVVIRSPVQCKYIINDVRRACLQLEWNSLVQIPIYVHMQECIRVSGPVQCSSADQVQMQESRCPWFALLGQPVQLCNWCNRCARKLVRWSNYVTSTIGYQHNRLHTTSSLALQAGSKDQMD